MRPISLQYVHNNLKIILSILHHFIYVRSMFNLKGPILHVFVISFTTYQPLKYCTRLGIERNPFKIGLPNLLKNIKTYVYCTPNGTFFQICTQEFVDLSKYSHLLFNAWSPLKPLAINLNVYISLAAYHQPWLNGEIRIIDNQVTPCITAM